MLSLIFLLHEWAVPIPLFQAQVELIRDTSLDVCLLNIPLLLNVTPFSLFLGVLLPSPADCLLTGPGSLCPGDMATLTCNVTGGLSQEWVYNNTAVGLIIPISGQVPAPQIMDGVEFRLSLLSANDTVSQITFVANEDMDGRVVECRTTFSRSSMRDDALDPTTLQVGSGSECTHARARSGTSNFLWLVISASVTKSWSSLG
jgi:hypothetical protein